MTAPLIAVLDYGIGNLRSAEKALQRVGADARLTKDAGLAREASAVVLPGVGAFGACLRALRSENMEQVVFDAIDSGRPFLGICVGMQMLFSGSEEDPIARGLGVIPGSVVRLSSNVKCPQMQWNRLDVTAVDDPMFSGAELESGNMWMYFVHSYAGVPEDPTHVAATCEYGGTINAAFRKGNVFATQFHPEKSGMTGLSLLANFTSAAKREFVGP